MRYYTRVDDRPSSPAYMTPLSLHRWYTDQDGELALERWDRDTKEWVDNPNLLAVTGVGGAHNYFELEEDEVGPMLEAFGASADVKSGRRTMPINADENVELVDAQEDDKAGRRVRQDKVSLIERIKKEFADLQAAVSALLNWAKYEDGDTKAAKYQVQPFHSNYGKSNPEAKWSFSASDGNAILDKGGWKLYKEVHLVTDTGEEGTPENKAAYKYPVAKLVDGKPAYFFRAAAAVNAALSGGARRAKLPRDVDEKVAKTVRSIYKAFDKDPEAVTVKGRFITTQGRAVFVGGPGAGGGGGGAGATPLDAPPMTGGEFVIAPGSAVSEVKHEWGGTHAVSVSVPTKVPVSPQDGVYSRGVEQHAINLARDAVGNELGIDPELITAKIRTHDQAGTTNTVVVETLTPSKSLSYAVAFKARDGRDWWLQFTSNAFKDREAELFTTQALKDYVARHRDNDIKGEFWYRHIPGTKFADVKWQAVTGRFLVQAGPFDDTPVGTTFKNFFTKYAHGHPAIAPQGWGTSHGYFYDAEDRKDGVYNWLEIKESTVLPAHLASNPWSPMPVIVTRSKKMNKAEKAELMKIGGQRLVDLVIEQGEGRTKELEGFGIAHKMLPPDAMAELVAISEAIEDEALRTRLLAIIAMLEEYYAGMAEEAEEMPEEMEAVVEEEVVMEEEKAAPEQAQEQIPDTVTREEIAETLKEVVGVLRSEIKSSQDSVTTTITEALTPLLEQVKELKRTDEEKVAEQVAAKTELTPAASLKELVKSAIGDPATEVSKDDPLLQKGPQTADQAQQLAAQTGLPSFLATMISGSDWNQ